jgi:hypothetical protein
MEITVKNISVNLANSEETHCFSAVVHVNGRKAFLVRNAGHGGCDMIDTIQGYSGPTFKEVDQWLKDNKPATKYDSITIEHSLEIEVSDQVNAFLQTKERKKTETKFNRILAGKCIGLKDNSVFVWDMLPSPENLRKLRSAKPEYEFINDGNAELREKALKAYCPNIDGD